MSIAAFLIVSVCSAQTTTFNFQGRLNSGGNPANGNFEMQFTLFDAVAGGSQIGAVVVRPNVVAVNGIFSTQLDFGGAAFNGAARFVEIGVRSEGSTGPFETLTPRQQVLSTPYAIQAKNADQLGGINASEYVSTATVGSSFIRNGTTLQTANFSISGNGFFGGNVGIGTTAPATKLQVQTTGYGITQTGGGVTIGSFINTASGGSGWFGTRSNHPLNFFTNDSLPLMTIGTTGNVGIGTTTPTAKLEVLNANVGSTGVYAESASGRALWGKSVGSRGVYGESSSLEGVYGTSTSGAGVSGNSVSHAGVYGESTSLVGVGIYAKNVAGGRAFYAEGNIGQSITANGAVKAMLKVNQIGAIVGCHNGVTNSSSGNCGFTVTRPLTGVYRIDYAFPVANRFVSVTPEYNTAGDFDPSLHNLGANYRFFNSTSVEVFVYIAGNPNDTHSGAFMIIMY